METERRAIKELEVRQDEGEPLKIRGYAAVFNSMSEDLGGFREIIKKGAFRDSLKAGADVVALYGHDDTKILGRRNAGTLELKEDSKGLSVTITPPDTQEARDVAELIRTKHLDAMSFGFRTVTDNWKTVDNQQIRELRQVDLFDVSVVTYPAYQQTQVALRSLQQRQQADQDWIETQRRRLAFAETE